MDCTEITLRGNRACRMLSGLDTYSRGCVAIGVDVSRGRDRVVRVLDRLGAGRPLPRIITVDNRPEFHSKALDAWARTRGGRLKLIRLGKPVDNEYTEAFTSRVRDESLHQRWFQNLDDAGQILERWRINYNTDRLC